MGCPPKIADAVQVGTPLAVLDGFLADPVQPEERIGHSLVLRDPVGVVAAITPWNYPLHQVVAKVAPALVAGCTVVLKPSELAPSAALLLTEVLGGGGSAAGGAQRGGRHRAGGGRRPGRAPGRRHGVLHRVDPRRS